MMKIITLLIIFLLSIISCNFEPFADKNLIKYIKEFKMPIYNSGYDVDRFIIHNGLIKGLKYKAVEYYPAENLIAFYKKAMFNKGYTVSDDNSKKSSGLKWRYYKDSTIDGSPDAAIYSLQWDSPDQKYSALLILRYFWYNKQGEPIILQNNNDLHIRFQILPSSML